MVCLYIGKATVKESGREEGTNGTAVYKSPNRKMGEWKVVNPNG